MENTARTEDGCYILSLSSHKLMRRELLKLKNFLFKRREFTFALDFRGVKKVSVEFLEFLKNLPTVSIYGASSEVLTYMSLLNMSTFLNIYNSREDCLAGKRRFVKRSFIVIKQLCLLLLPLVSLLCL